MTSNTAKLKEISEFVRGITFSPKDVIEKASKNSIGVIRTKNVQKFLDLDDVWQIDKKFIKNKKQYLVKGDLIVSSANSWNLVGKACWVDDLDFPCSFGGFVTVLRANKKKIHPRYLYYWFVSERTQIILRSLSNKTTNISNLNLKKAGEIEIPVPSLEEQSQIYRLLDKINYIKELYVTTLNKLDELITNLFFDLFGDQVKNSKKWPLKTLEEVLNQITYGLTVRPKYISDGIPLISAKQIRDNFIDFNSSPKISLDDYENLSDKCKPKLSDILFSKTGSIGHCALVETSKAFAISQNTARLSFNTSIINSTYALHYLRSIAIQVLSKRSAKGNAVKDLQLGKMKKFPFPLPPLSLQKKFTSNIFEIEKIKIKYKDSLKKIDQLLKAFTNKSFIRN